MNEELFVEAGKTLGTQDGTLWEWISSPAESSLMGHEGYLVKRQVRLRLPSIEGSGMHQPSADDVDDMGHHSTVEVGGDEDDDRLPSSTEDSEHCVGEFHAMFSDVFRVPVMYFNIYLPCGRLATLSEMSSCFPHLAPTQSGWCNLIQAEHPVLGMPFFQLHPCNTAQFMQLLWKGDEVTPDAWLGSWLSLVETTLNIPRFTATGSLPYDSNKQVHEESISQ